MPERRGRRKRATIILLVSGFQYRREVLNFTHQYAQKYHLSVRGSTIISLSDH